MSNSLQPNGLQHARLQLFSSVSFFLSTETTSYSELSSHQAVNTVFLFIFGKILLPMINRYIPDLLSPYLKRISK